MVVGLYGGGWFAVAATADKLAKERSDMAVVRRWHRWCAEKFSDCRLGGQTFALVKGGL